MSEDLLRLVVVYGTVVSLQLSIVCLFLGRIAVAIENINREGSNSE